jgi:response regulator RpfG family c-di-GMP phosphodiesterase
VGDPGSAIQCLKLGATDYLIKPVELEELAHALQYALRKRQLEIERREMEQWLAREVAEKTKELSEQSRQVELLALSIMQSQVDESEPPGQGGRNRSMRVANLSAHVGSELGADPEMVEFIRLAARLHEVSAQVLDPLRRYAEVVRIIRHQDDRFDAIGDAIPLGARVVAVTKRFDRLTEGTGTMKSADALRSLHELAGSELDPSVVTALAAVVGRRAH